MSMGSSSLGAFKEFISHLGQGAEVLDASPESALALLQSMGFAATRFDANDEKADLRLLSLPRERYDGVWAHRSLFDFKADECRRAMASFFYTLKSGGILFVSFKLGKLGNSGEYVEDDYASLVRQHGFRLLSAGKDPLNPEQIAFISTRI